MVTALRGNDLALLDVGGRIQPYRPLGRGEVSRYVPLDLQMEELVDVVPNGKRLPVKDGSFDVVLCSDALQYIPDAPPPKSQRCTVCSALTTHCGSAPEGVTPKITASTGNSSRVDCGI